MMLQQKQGIFVDLLGLLIQYARIKGWYFTLSDLGNQQGKKHMKGSLHDVRLAADLNLFVDDKYMATDCPEWQELGRYWKSLNSMCAWGGDFKSKDFNHFSLRHAGKA
jgi:hypothetical protein